MKGKYSWPLALLLAAGLAAQQAAPPKPQQQRDLKFEKDEEEARPPESGEVVIPRSYALIVGIARYQNLPEDKQLHFSERDADAIYSILISPEGGNFRAENVRKLVGPSATLSNLKKELEQWLPSVAREGDRVLIYFAGHGFIHGGRAYLAPFDFRMQNIAGTGYPMEALGKVIGSSVKAKWKVLLTDACHSGAITPETDPRALNGAFLDLHSSLFSMTASRDREQSNESPDWGGGHGIFTYYVVRGMEGYADTSGDGVVTADELFEYVRANVREATGNRQTPTADRGSFDPNMLLAYKRSGAKVASAVASKTGSLIFESNMDGVEVFLDGKAVGTVNKSQPLRIPGLPPGAHIVKGVKMGYEPDGPREETVYPGEEKTVSIKILIARRRNRAAVDKFDEGLEYYQRGFAKNYRKAAELFQQALAADPNYSQAALYLARTYSALYEPEKAFQNFQKAIEIDPTYYEAKASYAGSLLDAGRTDESIVQLNDVLQRQPDNSMALYLSAQAFRIKEMYGESINAARKAIRLTPKNPEPHFWLAESLRMSGKHDEAVKEYLEYLRLSDFNSKLAGNLHYYVTGFLVGLGKRKRAAQQDIWQDLRSLAYFGICDSSRVLKRYDDAINACRKSLDYDPQDPYTHYVLGNTLMRKARDTGDLELLAEARRRFRSAVELNENLAEAEMARKNIATIETFLKQTSR